MICPRGRDIDFAEFLDEPTAARWAGFRTHHPTCPECTAELAVWSSLNEALEASGGHPDAHPAADRLLAFFDQPATLSPAELAMLDVHVEACAQCRDTKMVFTSLHRDRLERGPAARNPQRQGSRFLVLIEKIRMSIPAPALAAVAVILLAALPTFFALSGGWRRMGSPEVSPQVLAQADQPIAPELPDLTHDMPPTGQPATESPGREPATLESPSESPRNPVPVVAGLKEPAPVAGEAAELQQTQTQPLPLPEFEPRPQRIAHAEAEPSSSIERTAQPAPESPSRPVTPMPSRGEHPAGTAPAPLREPTPQPVLIASNDLGPPTYSFQGTRFGRELTLRGGQSANSILQTLAPPHVGRTLSASPKLFWFVSNDLELPIDFDLIDDRAIKPVLRVRLPPPHRAGIHGISLADHDVVLEVGVRYRWFVSSSISRHQSPVRSEGRVERVEPAVGQEAGLDVTNTELGHAYARLGLWYDAFDLFSSRIMRNPGDSSLRIQRAALLDQVDREIVAQYDRQAVEAGFSDAAK